MTVATRKRKRCSKCRQKKPLSEFAKDNAHKTAVAQRYCRECNSHSSSDAEKAKRNTTEDMAYLLLKFGAHKTDCLVNSFHERGVDPTPKCSCGWADLSTVVEKMASTSAD